MPAARGDWARCPLFLGMTADERNDVLELTDAETVPPGTVILAERETARTLCIVLAGSCEVVIETRNRGERRLALVDAPAVFGEMSFFSPAPLSATVRTLSEVELRQLPRVRYDGLVARGSTAAQKLLENTVTILADRLRSMDCWARNFLERHDPARERPELEEFRALLQSACTF